MGFQLTIAEGKEAGREFVFEQSSVTIGRSSDCDVVLYDPGVSRRHCRIFSEGEGFYVEDLGSSNGTKVNGEVVKKHELGDDDSITLGPVVFKFVGTVMDDATPSEPGVADQHTRIVAADSIKRQKNKGAALVPQNAKEPELDGIRRSPTRAMQAVSRPRNTGGTAALARKPVEEPEENERPAKLARPSRPPPAAPIALSAAERARIRRESPGMLANLKIFWLEASGRTKQLIYGGAGLMGLLLVGLIYWAVLGTDENVKQKPPEPDTLTRKTIPESFGLGGDVDYERSDMKVFNFEFVSPTRALAILTYQAMDVSQNEVTITVNGVELGQVPPDTIASQDRVIETLIKPEMLKKGERNQLIFDNMKNPPAEDPWKIWNLRIEVIPLPEIALDQLIEEAKNAFERGVRNMERRDIGAQNRYEAWKDFRNAWLLLEGHPDPKPELYEIARVKVREAQQELDRTCAKLMLEVEKYYNQNDWDSARGTLDHVAQYFPNPNDQICPLKAERKRYEMGL